MIVMVRRTSTLCLVRTAHEVTAAHGIFRADTERCPQLTLGQRRRHSREITTAHDRLGDDATVRATHRKVRQCTRVKSLANGMPLVHAEHAARAPRPRHHGPNRTRLKGSSPYLKQWVGAQLREQVGEPELTGGVLRPAARR